MNAIRHAADRGQRTLAQLTVNLSGEASQDGDEDKDCGGDHSSSLRGLHQGGTGDDFVIRCSSTCRLRLTLF